MGSLFHSGCSSARVRAVARAGGLTAIDGSDLDFTIVASCPLPEAPAIAAIAPAMDTYRVEWPAVAGADQP